MAQDLVLVTGGTGFLGTHLIAQLIAQGYRVRTSVRTLDREVEIRESLGRAGADPQVDLDLVVADLSSNDGWAGATDGVRFVLHVASPFPPAVPESDDDVIVPARDGALRVLQAARDSGVERVVMTSSFAAVGYGHEPTDRPFTEEDWTNLDAPLGAYIRSKAVAERAAWDFIDDEAPSLELAVVNPVGIFGPPLSADLSSSVQLAQQLLSLPAVPRLATTVVDVRDVADLHIRAMTHTDAAGQRFLASTGEPLPFGEVAEILRTAIGRGDSVPPTLPDEVVREGAKTDPGMANMVGELGKVRRVSGEKARTLLGWQPRSNVDALSATAIALQNLGLV